MQENLPIGVEIITPMPELWEQNRFYFKAWCDLQSKRPQGTSGVVGFAPTEIECWARYCWPGDIPEFMRRILKVDTDYCIAIHQKQAREDETSKEREAQKPRP